MAPRQDPAAPEPGATDSIELALRLDAVEKHAYDVLRGSPDPLAAEPALADPDPLARLRYELRAQAGEEDGTTLLVVELSRAAELGQRGATLAVFQAHVGRDGSVLKLTQRKADEGEPVVELAETDPLNAAAPGEPDVRRVRLDLERILGAGLHAQRLQPGESYRLGSAIDATARPVEASAAAAGLVAQPEDEAHLRFDGVQAAGTGKTATFTILPAQKGSADDDGARPAADREREAPPEEDSSRGQLGRATYSLADGLLEQFEYRPKGSAPLASGDVEAEPLVLAWVTIQRVRRP